MEPLAIQMKRIKSTKRFDVFEAILPEAYITTVYINKAARCPEEIILMVEAKA